MAKQIKTTKEGKKPKNKKRSIIEEYTKHFSNITELAEDILNIPGCINQHAKDLFENEVSVYIEDTKAYRNGDEDIIMDMHHLLIRMYLRNIPNCLTNFNSFWAINLSMDRAFLKTGESFGIGWIITRDEKGITDITATYKAFIPVRLKDEIKYLLDNGWAIAKDKEDKK